jgi:hypothetical protein
MANRSYKYRLVRPQHIASPSGLLAKERSFSAKESSSNFLATGERTQNRQFCANTAILPRSCIMLLSKQNLKTEMQKVTSFFQKVTSDIQNRDAGIDPITIRPLRYVALI